MHYDIEAYNRAYVDSEVDMLLFNIGRLSHDQPPHFMMLSEVDQTRAFSASAAFSWAHLWNNLWIGPKTANIATRSSDAFQAGPFAAASTENPTFKFLPIQGQDFAQRFESPLTDKFTYFLEERRWQPGSHQLYVEDVIRPFISLFVDSLKVNHGDSSCLTGIYQNVVPKSENDPKYVDFWRCVGNWDVTDSKLLVENLEGGESLTTRTSQPPTASDVESALKEGYRWKKNGADFVLTHWFQMPAYLNFDVRGTRGTNETCSENSGDADSKKLTWEQRNEPPYRDLAWNLPKNYMWKYCKGKAKPFELVPVQEPPETVVLEKANLPYADEIIRYVEPFPQDYVYVELRNGGLNVTADVAQNACFPKTQEESTAADKLLAETPGARVLCGYLKIGDFLSIMRRLADHACRPAPGAPADRYCEGTQDRDSFVGIGPKVPPWADRFVRVDGQDYVWVPAHRPTNNPGETDLAKRDREMFLEVYKLYQTSLVDTSKLVTGTTPITISK